MNYICIHGRIVENPELKRTQNDIPVCNIMVAVNRNYSGKEGESNVDFFKVICWRGLAEMICNHFHKGKEILLSGEMQSNKWKDKDGNNRISWQIIANKVDFCGNKEETKKDEDISYDEIPDGFSEFNEEDEDIPF